MIIHFSDCVGVPLVHFETGDLLGLIKDVIVRPQDGRIEAFWVKSLAHPWQNRILQTQDILEWKKNAYVRNPDAISLPSEIIRIVEILQKKTEVIDNRVFDEENRYLGKVYDFDFNTEEFILRNIYVGKRFLWKFCQPRIIGSVNIIEIFPDYIRVRDLEVKKGVLPLKEGILGEGDL